MPTINEHLKLSLKRTGKDYRELHKWVEEFHSTKKEKEERHDILKIPEFLSFIEDKFGKVGVQEYLYHIKEDYEKSRAYKLAKALLKLKFWQELNFNFLL